MAAACRRRTPLLLLALLARCHASAAPTPPQLGPWPVAQASYNASALDGSDPKMWLVYPVCNNATGACPHFPLLAYAHGMAGGDITLLAYSAHFARLASWGFVVAAPDSCDVGCTDASGGAPWTDCAGLPDVQPALWPAFYGEQLKAIDWARNMTATSADAVFATIDWAAGVGIAGHSMGGQATAIAAGARMRRGVGHPRGGAAPQRQRQRHRRRARRQRRRQRVGAAGGLYVVGRRHLARDAGAGERLQRVSGRARAALCAA